MHRRFSRPGAALAAAALLIGSAIVVAGGGPADAAPAPGAKASPAASAKASPAVAIPKTPVLPDEPKVAYSKAEAEDVGNCFSSRRKLFVEGEGWIVRKVTTCR